MKTIVISAINIFSGGALTILNNCLDTIVQTKLYEQYNIITIVHKKELFTPYAQYIKLIDLPKSRNGWLKRIYYEYFYFKKLSKQLKPYLWLSLHDITPSVTAEKRAVYCHNPSPFLKLRKLDLKFDYKIVLFSLLYKYLYRINIHKNDFVIVQQQWLKNEFIKMYKLQDKKTIVAYASQSQINKTPKQNTITTNSETTFFYPSLPRQFKNFELICQAAEILNTKNCKFKVILSIDGSENSYSKWILDKYRNIPNVDFHGLIPFNEMEHFYGKTDCLIFPSRLETWGLPISEFANYNKPMLLADLPYAHETSYGAKLVGYFNSNSAEELAEKMMLVIEKKYVEFHPEDKLYAEENSIAGFSDLFKTLLN